MSKNVNIAWNPNAKEATIAHRCTSLRAKTLLIKDSASENLRNLTHFLGYLKIVTNVVFSRNADVAKCLLL